ncbi:MAG: hypothetical protein GXC73_20300 [Chitinophagaceae bacterium]|nr:hypothetical protein [Chitinophagaceae bacterium]
MTAKKILPYVILWAFVTRLLYLYSFPLRYTDFYLINTAAQNLADGYGMGFIRSSASDLSLPYFEGLRLWPPLLTGTVSQLYKLTGNIYLANNILLFASLSLLFLFTIQLCKLLELTEKSQVCLYVFFALSPELIKFPGLSDLAAATCTLGASVYLLKFLLKKQKLKKSSLFLLAFLFFLPSAFRYQFYVLSLALPVLLFLSSLYLKDNALKKDSLLLILFTFSFLLLQELFLYIYANQPLDKSVSMDKSGFFPYNLLTIYPFFTKTFLNLSYLENVLSSTLAPYRRYYFLISFFLFIVWFVTIIRALHLNTKNQKKSKKTLIPTILLLVSVLPFFTLSLLSLRYNSRSGEPGGWTYVNEGRYYIVCSVLVLILSIWYVQARIKEMSSTAIKTLYTILILIVTYNAAFTFKFYVNVLKQNFPDREITNRQTRKSIDSIISVYAAHPEPLVITYHEPYFTFHTYKHNVYVTDEIKLFIKKDFRTSKPVRLLAITNKPLSRIDSILVKKTKAHLISEQPTTLLYLASIPASTKTEAKH